MEKKKLYLLMQAFPLKQREAPFISPELPFLKENFDVTIVPLEEVGASATAKAVAFLKTAVSPLLYRQIILAKKDGKSPAKVLPFSFFMLWRANIYADYLKKNVFEAKDAVVYSYWYNELALGPLLLKKQFPGYKFVTRCHRYDLYDFAVPSGYHPYKEYMDNLIDKVIFISEMGKKYYLDRYQKTDCDKYTVHYLGVQTQTQKATESGSTLRLVSCSHVKPVKRVPLIMDALTLIKDFDVSWHHFGDGEELASFKHRASSFDKNISASFMGHYPNAEYISWLENNPVDLFINVSSSEGLPVTLMEAASFGIPCIATDVGGSCEIVSAENGTLLSPDPTAEEVAQAITDFYHLSSDERKQKGDNSYKLWQTSFNSETNAQRVVDMLKQL